MLTCWTHMFPEPKCPLFWLEKTFFWRQNTEQMASRLNYHVGKQSWWHLRWNGFGRICKVPSQVLLFYSIFFCSPRLGVWLKMIDPQKCVYAWNTEDAPIRGSFCSPLFLSHRYLNIHPPESLKKFNSPDLFLDKQDICLQKPRKAILNALNVRAVSV